jgi:hypothetical protein
MNEQIEILFKQAGGYFEMDAEGNLFTYTQDFDPEYFALLIIKESASVADKHVRHGDIDVARIIKRHFGVEE